MAGSSLKRGPAVAVPSAKRGKALADLPVVKSKASAAPQITGFGADPFCLKHDPGFGHPETPRRYELVILGLEEAGLIDKMVRLPTRDATRPELRRVHMSHYLDLAEFTIKDGVPELATGDTAVCEDSWDVALRSAGLALSAVDAVMSGQMANAFCAIRPPGHHANAARGMGFCIVNNVAIAARHAQAAHGAKRVLIVDWDVHHGNGTQDIFYEDGSVLFFSTHQWPLYPGTGRRGETGAGPGEGLTINCPLPEGSGHKEVLGSMLAELVPAADRFQPDLVLISAGFDSRLGDPMGGFTLTKEDFAEMTRVVKSIAARHCNGKLVSLLEGGYGSQHLGEVVAAHVGALVNGE
jgi:acetoin utilization deacetylase AcuC-like enzyme